MIDHERRFNTRRGENIGYHPPKATWWEKISVVAAIMFFVSWLISRLM